MGSGGFGLGDGGPSRWERWKQNRELRKYQEAFSRESQRGSRGSYSGGGFTSYHPSFEDAASKVFAFLFFVALPVFGIYWEACGAESCRGRAAIRAQDKERETWARGHAELEPKYAKMVMKNAKIVESNERDIIVEVDGARRVFAHNMGKVSYHAGYLADEYADFLVFHYISSTRGVEESWVISKHKPAQVDTGEKAPQSRPAAQEAGPGPSSREAENEASEFIAKKYKEYGEQCTGRPKGKIDFARCDRIEASLSVAFSVLHEDRCKGSARKDEEHQKYCDFIRQQMKQPIPKGIRPRRPLKHFQ